MWRLLVETLQLLIAPLQWFLNLLAAFFTQPAPRHKRRSRRTRGGQGGGRSASNAGWAYGRNSSNQAKWLVDCYRMRLEDDSDYGGGCAGKLLCGQVLHADLVRLDVAGTDKVPNRLDVQRGSACQPGRRIYHPLAEWCGVHACC